MPLVSVIIATYKEEFSLLERAIQSLYSQTYKDFEILLVNDNPDREIKDQPFLQDSRVTIISNSQNLGLTKSLNMAAERAEGKYIARLDADDFSVPERIKTQVEFLESKPDYVMVGSRAYEEIGGEMKDQHVPFCKTDSDIRKASRSFNPMNHSSLMFRKKVFTEIGGYNETFTVAQDYELLYQMLKRGRVENLPTHLIIRRVESDTISETKRKKQEYYSLRARLKICSSFGIDARSLFNFAKSLAIIAMPILLYRMLRPSR